MGFIIQIAVSKFLERGDRDLDRAVTEPGQPQQRQGMNDRSLLFSSIGRWDFLV